MKSKNLKRQAQSLKRIPSTLFCRVMLAILGKVNFLASFKI